jgi:outer membrane protein TolC
MLVKRSDHLVFRHAGVPVLLGSLIFSGMGTAAWSQMPNPSSATNPFYGSVTARPASDETLKLSLDEAVSLGLKNNLGLKEAENNEKLIQGEKNEAIQAFLPTITLSADTGVYQHNLAALGFGPGVVSKFASLFPSSMLGSFHEITRDTLTDETIHFSQVLFSGPVIAAIKGANAATKAAHFAKMTARGEVVQQVASAYLHAIAAASEVDNAKAQVDTAEVLFSHAHDAHVAGIAANLDELRAKVQLQTQQQSLIAAQNEYEKDLILLKREIGVDPGQRISLTDPAPSSELAVETPEEVRAIAYKNRQDFQNLQNEVVEYQALHAAYRSERLPTLSFSSYYQTSTVNGAGTRGNFMAQGTLSVPLFREAGLRGDADASQAQLDAVNAQLADLRSHIDQQVRSALLDVDANAKLVEVARSNVELATRALSDETDRVNAGVDDNLPLVTAQSTLASAQSNLVESLYQYNLSKLVLARSAGVLELQYRDYLGR